MGKRNKKTQIKLSEKELEPVTIGILEENKKGLLGLIFLFIIFIAFALFLPNITSYVNKLLDKEKGVVVTPKEEEKENEPEENEEIQMYDLNEDLAFSVNHLTFSNFNTYQTGQGYFLSFNILNEGEVKVDFSENKYFIETYSLEKTLLDRHIFNYSVVNAKANATQIIQLSEEEYKEFSKMVISLKTDKDYNDVTLSKEKDDEYTLECKKEESNIVYTFDQNNNLIKIADTFTYKNDNSANYITQRTLYLNRVANYNNKKGVSSNLIEISSGFTATTEIEIKEYNWEDLNNEYYYKTNATPKVVKFEMEARGFTCE